MRALEAVPPSTAGLTKRKVGAPISLTLASGELILTVNSVGAISSLTDTGGRAWAADSSLLWLRYSLITNKQMADYRATYCTGNFIPGDAHCGEGTYGKPGMPGNTSLLANATVRGVYSSEAAGVLLVELGWAKQLHDNYGAPESTWLKVSVGADGVSLDAQVLLVEKTSTRMMEAMFLTFAPSRNCDWSMDKLGEFVGAKDVMMGGSGGVSSIGSGVMCSLNGTAVDGKQQQRMFVRSLDSAVVHWGSDTAGPSMLPTGQGQGAAPWTQSEADVSAGAHCVLFDNLWNTNYIFWWPYLKSTSAANIVYRFRLEFA